MFLLSDWQLPTFTMDMKSRNSLHLQIKQLHSGTYFASVIDETHHYNISTVQNEYDDTGALYYVIAVVLMYGCSIILMIGSSIKKSKNDNGVHKYMKDMDKIKRLARRQEKFKTRLVMYRKRYYKDEPCVATKISAMEGDTLNDEAQLSDTDVISGELPELPCPTDLPQGQPQYSIDCTQSQPLSPTGCTLSDMQTSFTQDTLIVEMPELEDRILQDPPTFDMSVTPVYIVPLREEQGTVEPLITCEDHSNQQMHNANKETPAIPDIPVEV